MPDAVPHTDGHDGVVTDVQQRHVLDLLVHHEEELRT